jgi:hypothetical protein
LEKKAFHGSGLRSIHLPRSLEMICRSCFACCTSLASVTFDLRSRIRARVSELRAGIPFDCRSSDAIRDTRTSSGCCSVN